MHGVGAGGKGDKTREKGDPGEGDHGCIICTCVQARATHRTDFAAALVDLFEDGPVADFCKDTRGIQQQLSDAVGLLFSSSSVETPSGLADAAEFSRHVIRDRRTFLATNNKIPKVAPPVLVPKLKHQQGK